MASFVMEDEHLFFSETFPQTTRNTPQQLEPYLFATFALLTHNETSPPLLCSVPLRPAPRCFVLRMVRTRIHGTPTQHTDETGKNGTETRSDEKQGVTHSGRPKTINFGKKIMSDKENSSQGGVEAPDGSWFQHVHEDGHLCW